MQLCRDFQRGTCRRGSACRFLHPGAGAGAGADAGAGRARAHARNTQSFEPLSRPVDLRAVLALEGPGQRIQDRFTTRDVILAPSLFADFEPGKIFRMLVDEVETCGVPQDRLLKMWHGDSHLIADDHTHWKENAPTFSMVIARLAASFGMDVQATRFNWYRDTGQWKPFHHDAAAVKPEKAEVQNFTVAASFGATREAAFEHARRGTILSFPQRDGEVYAFTRDTNVIWRHGILREPEVRPEGRISIIAWGWVDGLRDVGKP